MGKDAAGSLKKISDMGYSTAETASYGDGKFYGRTPAEFRKMAEDVGIRVTGAHLGRGYDAGWEDWWKQACDAQAAVGGKVHRTAGHRFREDGSRSEKNLRILRQGGEPSPMPPA